MLETRPTILIVDDSPEDRATFRRFLGQDRNTLYRVQEAEMGEQALSRLLGNGTPLPDCLLVDFNLPDMTGIEFLQELAEARLGGAESGSKTDSFLPCAVVMLTGSGDESAAVAAMKAGVQDYLVKGSLSSEALRHAVQNALEKFDLARRLRNSEARLRLATEAAGIGTWTYNPRTGEVTGDTRFGELLGLSEIGSLDYRECLSRVSETDRKRVLHTMQVALKSSGPQRHDVEYRTLPGTSSNNTLLWVQSHAQAFLDPSQTVVERLVGTVRDVTEQKQMEEERARYSARQEHIAETLQLSLLNFSPQGTFTGLDVYVEYSAAWEEALVGGDFADVFALEGGKVALVVGDVAGKGLAAATYAAEVKFALRAFSREFSDPAEVLNRLNHYLISGQRLDAEPHWQFVALVLAIMDTETREVQCVCAGADPPLIVRRGAAGTTPKSEVIPVSGPLLAVSADSKYETVTAHMEIGDMFALTTDGITEARVGRGGELFGYERFVESTERAILLSSLQDAAKVVVADAQAFANGAQSDDICLLVAR